LKRRAGVSEMTLRGKQVDEGTAEDNGRDSVDFSSPELQDGASILSKESTASSSQENRFSVDSLGYKSVDG
jgi:hypothetical protein